MISPHKPTSYIFATQPTLSMSYLRYNKIFFRKKWRKKKIVEISAYQIVDTIMFSICHFHVVVLLQLSSVFFPLLLNISIENTSSFYHIILISFSWYWLNLANGFYTVNIDKYAYLLSGTSFCYRRHFFFVVFSYSTWTKLDWWTIVRRK